jgi:hypothetical protein
MSEKRGGRTARCNDHLTRVRAVCDAGTKICLPERATALLEAIIVPGDRVTKNPSH